MCRYSDALLVSMSLLCVTLRVVLEHVRFQRSSKGFSEEFDLPAIVALDGVWRAT